MSDDLEKKLSKIVEEDSDAETGTEDNEEETNVSGEEEEDSEFEEIDVTDNPLYQVLSAFFETEEGENICEILKDLNETLRENMKMMNKLLKSSRGK